MIKGSSTVKLPGCAPGPLQELPITPGRVIGRGDLIYEFIQMSILQHAADEDIVWPDEWYKRYGLIRRTLNQITERIPGPRARGSQ